MPVFTVHAPVRAGAVDTAATDRFVFVRDGFHLWAALFGALWFAVHRLWLALLGYLVIVLALAFGLWALKVGSDVRTMVMLLVALLTGFEASSLWRWTLSRGKWRQLDMVVADSRETAERRFFDRWAAGRTTGEGGSVDRGEPPPVRPAAAVGGADGEIMGLFPQPGAGR